MDVRAGLDGLRRLPAGAVLTIGNFDGVHRGHRRILDLCRTTATTLGGRPVAVATFEPHPLTVLRPELAPPRLTHSQVKEQRLAAAGADHLVVLPPTPDVLGLTAEAFWAILRDEARVAHLVEGETFTFGKGRGGTVDRLREWSSAAGVGLTVASPAEAVLTDLAVAPVSSSLVRWLLGHGRARDAAICLGRPYGLRGEVVRGFQRGRTIDVPTANLGCGDQLIPLDGVYAGRCEVDGVDYPAALSIGDLPTFAERAHQVEAHLIGFKGDLYGRTIEVRVTDWLREQWKFDGLEPLKAQIARDLSRTRELFGREPARELARV